VPGPLGPGSGSFGGSAYVEESLSDRRRVDAGRRVQCRGPVVHRDDQHPDDDGDDNVQYTNDDVRLDVQHVIFDKRIWTAGDRSDQGWRDYDPGDAPGDRKVLEHRDHVHVDVAAGS